MTRSTGWRFLSLGRRVERLSQLCAAPRKVATDGGRAEQTRLAARPDQFRHCRTRYPAAPGSSRCLDLLLQDEDQPTLGGVFQVRSLVRDPVDSSSARSNSRATCWPARRLSALGNRSRAESAALAALLEQLDRAARRTSDETTVKFFVHAASRQRADAGRLTTMPPARCQVEARDEATTTPPRWRSPG